MESNWPLLPTLFTLDTHQSRLQPQVQIGDAVAPMNRTPKILGVTLDTHYTIGPHARDCVERASRALSVSGPRGPLSMFLGFQDQNSGGHPHGHRALHSQLCRSQLVYPSVLTHRDKLEVIQNKALRIVAGFN